MLAHPCTSRERLYSQFVIMWIDVQSGGPTMFPVLEAKQLHLLEYVLTAQLWNQIVLRSYIDAILRFHASAVASLQ